MNERMNECDDRHCFVSGDDVAVSTVERDLSSETDELRD